MHISEDADRDIDELVTMAVARTPHLSRSEVEGIFDEQAVEILLLAQARDEDGTLAGWGVLLRRHAMPDGWYALRIVVRADREDQGVGGELHRRLRAQVPADAVRLNAKVFDDDERALAVSKHWGFEVQQLSITSRLVLDADLAPPALPAGVTAEDCSSLEFATEDDTAAVAAMLAASQTNPEAAFGVVMTFERLHDFVDTGHRPVAALLRRVGEPVAISFADLGPDHAHIVYTGVDPAQRGSGFGGLVKQHLQHLVAAAGVTVVRTENEEHNDGIRHVNAALGYEKTSGGYWLRHMVDRT